MVELHLVHDRHVELVEHERLRHVRRELRIADDRRNRPRAPAFVGDRKLGRAAEPKRRDDFEVERVDVVVVDDDRNVGRRLGHPLLRGLVALEHGNPVRFRGAAVVHRGADRGRVRRADAGDDLGHHSFLSDFDRQPFSERPPACIILT